MAFKSATQDNAKQHTARNGLLSKQDTVTQAAGNPNATSVCSALLISVITFVCFASLMVTVIFANRILEIEEKGQILAEECTTSRSEALNRNLHFEKLILEVKGLKRRLDNIENGLPQAQVSK